MKPQVAISRDFVESFSDLPEIQREKVRRFLKGFRDNPANSRFNFERLTAAVDSKARSVRIDQLCQLIVIHPPKGDVYLVVYVGNEEESSEWVRGRRFEVNPSSGNLQVYEQIDADKIDEIVNASLSGQDQNAELAPSRRLFDTFSNEELLLAGVPEVLVPAVREIFLEEQLDQLGDYLPSDAADVLLLMAAGSTLFDAVADVERQPSVSVDVDDFNAALQRDEGKAEFYVVESEKELNDVLEKPLEQWRVYLHPNQRRAVEWNVNGPVQISGGAGTGKTVALLHRAKYLLERVFTNESDRILITTYTTSLATEIADMFQSLAGELSRRADIVHLDRWAIKFLASRGHHVRIADERERHEYMQAAIDNSNDSQWTLSFCIDEWDRVVQNQGIQSRKEYLAVRRVGRGVALSKRDRIAVWSVLDEYRDRLQNAKRFERIDVVRKAKELVEREGNEAPYCAVLADELQDLTAEELKLLRTLARPGKNDMFVVGDAGQRIYGMPVTLGGCGIQIKGRSRKLRVNYRTTRQIKRRATAVLRSIDIDDMDGDVDEQRGTRSLRDGPDPVLRHWNSAQQENEFLIETVQSWLDEGVDASEICLTVRSNRMIDNRIRPLFENEGLQSVKLDNTLAARQKGPGVRLATMHRVKGLEFKRMIVVSVNDGVVPLRLPDLPLDEGDHEKRERCLFYVATTRARDELVISSWGKKSSFLAMER